MIAKEFTAFQMTNEMGSCLKKIYKVLQTVQPTSVEAERAFSAAGLFVTKLRSSLKDDSIDALCLLRSYFLLKNILQI